MDASAPQPHTPEPSFKRRRRVGATRRRILFAAVALLIAIAGYFGYQRWFPPPPIPPATVPVQVDSVRATVSTAGSIASARQARLSFGVAGRLRHLYVGIGDPVEAGQLLAELDSTSQEIRLAQAESSLRVAETQLKQLLAGAREGDVAAAQAAYDSAVAKYEDLLAGPSEAEMRNAEQAVFSARASLARAENDLARLRDGPREDEIVVARAELAKRELALQKAQSDYDRQAWRPDLAARPEALALQQATIDYQAALANYNLKMAGPTAADLRQAEDAAAGARAALAGAESRLAQLKEGPRPAEIEAARASVAGARATLLNRTEGPTTEEVALREEQVRSARIALRQAQADLANAQLVAPFDGVVGAIGAQPGEQVTGPFLTLVDPSAMLVEAMVDELDIVNLAVGQPAEVQLEALSDRPPFTGVVVAIAPSATVQQGVVSYLVTVAFDPEERRLPTGLSASAAIVVEERQGVLVVPNRAITSRGTMRVVEVLTEDGIEAREVTIGINDDQVTEVLAGLREGERVVIAPGPTRNASPFPGAGGQRGGPTGTGP